MLSAGQHPPELPVLTVSQLSALLKETLEDLFPHLWVSGEISNLRRQSSGHIYFDLKDEAAVIGSVIWKSSASRVRFDLKNGQEVLCQGGLNLYPPHGKYQFIVRNIEPRGEGALQLALRQLRQKLEAEGLFDPARKRELPKFPRRIAAVTSPTGAALRDFLQVLRRRWPGAEVLVLPARVQGEGAAAEIAAAIALANRLQPAPEVMFVGRGGGSLEDLWCFNEELVVRAIAASGIPIVAGVGHEIDTTLADLAADLRAPTPSAAAELIAPDSGELLRNLREQESRLRIGLRMLVARLRTRLDHLSERRPLKCPYERLQALSQRLDDLETRLHLALKRRIAATRERLGSDARRLESLSPLGVLARGYSLTQRADDGRLVQSAADVSPGDVILTRLAAGEITSRVEPLPSKQ